MGIKQGKWQGPLKAAETSGMSLSAYAVKHGINVRRTCRRPIWQRTCRGCHPVGTAGSAKGPTKHAHEVLFERPAEAPFRLSPRPQRTGRSLSRWLCAAN